MRPSDVLEPGSAYVFKLGPLGEGPERASAYIALTADGPPVLPVVARGDGSALAQLAPRLEGRRVQCEPRLGRAGARHGFTPGPVPEALVAVRAGLALSVLWEPGLTDPRPGLVASLLEAATALWENAPWREWTHDEPFSLHVEGGVRGEWEGCILGSGHLEYGFALYPEPGSVARVGALITQGREEEASLLDAVALTFEETPSWVRSAVRAATGLPRFPLPLQMTGGELSLLGPADLVLLTATARALADVSPQQREATGHASFEAIRLSVHVELPVPRYVRVCEDVGGEMLADAGLRGRPPHGPSVATSRVSEALLTFAQPLLAQLPGEVDEEALSEVLVFAMTAWNAVVLESVGEAPSAVAVARAQLERLPSQERAFLMPHFERLVRRKRRHFAEDLRVMQALEVYRRPGGDLAVRVMARWPREEEEPQPEAPA
ncbi:MAG: hypothetical protein L0Y66_10840 [Myxococcaceae bacterium]|nr:hypothetical protein [Myxococcaceae bacterium]